MTGQIINSQHIAQRAADAFNAHFPVGADVLVDTPAGTRLGQTLALACLVSGRCAAVRVRIGGKDSTQPITCVRKFEEPALP
jgi:hypothetical protein